MFGLGSPELLIILVVVLILFGGAKVPELMKGLGQGMREFRNATREDEPQKNELKSKDDEAISSSHKA